MSERPPPSPAGAGDAPPTHTRARGTAAEREAAAWLTARGYEIVDCNVRLKSGELDVVARDGDTLCFVEVKARENDLCGLAIEGVTEKQRQRIVRAAALYVALGEWRGPCRFDVLGMDREPAGQWRFTLLRGAFEAR